MTGEIIEVCQDCGHLIEPVEVTAPWGDRYRITLCQRDECTAERLMRDFAERFQRESADRLEREMRAFKLRHTFAPVVNNPGAAFRITGI